jgi:glycosyltransferase involved in cell wall biosynthesis
MKVTGIVRTDGACDFYRALQPLEQLSLNTEHKAYLIKPGDNADDVFKYIETADVILLPRVADREMFKVINKWKELGRKIVVDFDDDIFNVSPFSPHYEEHGLEEVTVQINGEEKKLWEDGVNFNIEENKKNISTLKAAVALADMVTVTTPILAEAYKQYNDNVVDLPNCIDLNLWRPLDLKPKDEIRLFWAGGSSHYEDWCLLSTVIPEIMDKYKNVKLVLLGMKFDGTLSGIDKDRIEFHPWVHTSAYPYKVAGLNPTIGVIPLVDNEFNRAKSPLKWLEMSALGVPCVTSLVSPYKEIATENNGVFIKNNSASGWVRGISLLIEDAILRAKMGGYAQRYVEKNFDAKKNAHLWTDAYMTLLEEKKEAV